MSLSILINLLIASAFLGVLFWMHQRDWSFTKRVFSALGFGIILGAAFQAWYGLGSEVIKETNIWLDVVGTGYVKLLQMVVIPLIMVSIIGAILKINGVSSLGKISALTIGTLITTTVIAACIGILMAHSFHLTAIGLNESAAEIARGEYLKGKLADAQALSIPNIILSFIPENPFLDMTGARKTSTIAVVIFSILIGISATSIADKKPEMFASFTHFVEVAQTIVMRLVSMILRLTPFGIFALITQVVAKSNQDDILKLLNFVVASYSAIILMFMVHLGIVAVCGLNPLTHARKILPVLVFAFTSRTSAGTIPLNVKAQTRRLGIPEGIANFSASFGAAMGQNGCGGIYPAMLAFMIAPTQGIDPLSLSFLASLLAIIAIGSVGVAGVGGGATFAALIVLSSLNLPVALAGLLISVEPLIDMGRTALNVSGSMTAGTLTSRLMGMTDKKLFNHPETQELDDETS